MINFTFDEKMMMCIYNTGTRTGLIENLKDMSTYLQPDEVKLKKLTDSTLKKLENLTDNEFETLDLVPDWDM